MQITTKEQDLCRKLKNLSKKCRNKYTQAAELELLDLLFRSLADNQEDNLQLFFPHGYPRQPDAWISLSEAQGAVDGSEYTQAARGKRCGHIFRSGEATYACRTCATDETCVLCTRCFDASDHESHQVVVSMSPGITGCCDCGDSEAWVKQVNCSIHSPIKKGSSTAGTDVHNSVPELRQETQDAIRQTVSRVFDFVCDIFSCAQDDLKVPKHKEAILQDERNSRLTEKIYQNGDDSESDVEFVLVVWNDEKHSMPEVEEQIARACKKPRSYGHRKAAEIDKIGRTVVDTSTDINGLLHKARILGELKITVSIRAARDNFREEMCGTMMRWLSDIASCSVGTDHDILMRIICEEMLRPWRTGSSASHVQIGGRIDQQKTDNRLAIIQQTNLQRRMLAAVTDAQNTRMEVEAARTRLNLARTNTDGAARLLDGDLNDDGDGDGGGGGENQDGAEDDGDQEDDEEAFNLEDETEDGEVFGMLDPDLAQFGQDRMDMDGDEIGDIQDNDFGTRDATLNDEDEVMIDILDIVSVPAQPLLGREDNEAQTSDDSENGQANSNSAMNVDTLLSDRIPRTPRTKVIKGAQTPSHWLEPIRQAGTERSKKTLHPWEDFDQHVRMDYLILYDLRMWKQLRNCLRSLYIRTMITEPTFKRVLGLRFAALYTHLAQLYLIADREPDHSIINLSVQMLTTPSITAEVVNRGKFLTRLLAILYTFLTKRQVGTPMDVDPTASIALDSGVLTNRRIFHFFSDLKFLLEADSVQEQIRSKDYYLPQFLDFARLFHGILPNLRATGEHVEFESEIWMQAAGIVKDFTRICRQFCSAFRWQSNENPSNITRISRETARAAIISSLLVGNGQSSTSDSGFASSKFKEIPVSEIGHFKVVEFEVEKEPMSFHHALHHTLSWVIEAGKSMSLTQLQGLLAFEHSQLQMSTKSRLPHLSKEEYLLTLFDIPLEVVAWMAQMKAGMWVRNGMTLRHQMQFYKSVGQREVSYQRDLFLLQTGLVVLPPATFLMSMIDRFNLTDWILGEEQLPSVWDEGNRLEVAEDLIHLLILLLSDRTLLHAVEDEACPDRAVVKREIINVLCFKALTFSELTQRLPERVYELEFFQEILEDITVYRAPEGIADSGTLHLRIEYYGEIDPYSCFYSKSQREEAENLYRKHVQIASGKNYEDVYYQPRLHPIKSGIFKGISRVVREPLFVKLISILLQRAIPDVSSSSATRLDALLQVLLQLILVAIAADDEQENQPLGSHSPSFVNLAIEKSSSSNLQVSDTIVGLLLQLLLEDKYHSNKGRIRFVLRQLHLKEEDAFGLIVQNLGTERVVEELFGSRDADREAKLELKKRQAMERQAKIMASFKRQQSAFLEQSNIAAADDLMDCSGPLSESSHHASDQKTWQFPTGTCIFCQEEMDDEHLFGILGAINPTNLLRETDLEDTDYVEELFDIPSVLDSNADLVRPFGVANKNIQLVSRVEPNGTLVETKRRGLGKGYSPSHYRRSEVFTGCGHLMHFHCFKNYSDATSRRHGYQVARNHSERLECKEFVCPLCKALGNAFLPLIWKPQTRLNMVQDPPRPFEDWLTTDVPFLVRRYLSETTPLLKGYLTYAAENFLPSFATKMQNLQKARSGRALSGGGPPTALAHRQRQGNPLTSLFAPLSSSGVRPLHGTNASDQIIEELFEAYERLRAALKTSSMQGAAGLGDLSEHSEPSQAQDLARILGCSLSSQEIALRGASTTGNTLIGSIPEHQMNILRVFCESVRSYIALGTARQQQQDSGGSIVSELTAVAKAQLTMLFEEPRLSQSTADADGIAAVESLLEQDTFIFLTACSIYMIPMLHFDFHHILRLSYQAEITKAVLFILMDGDVFAAVADGQKSRQQNASFESSQPFSIFVQSIYDDVSSVAQRMGDNGQALMSRVRHALAQRTRNPNERYAFDRALRTAVSRYALVFLRKAVLLLHVRFAIDFDQAELAAVNHGSELSRLSALLKLPGLDELMELYANGGEACTRLQLQTRNWILHYMVRLSNSSNSKDVPRNASNALSISPWRLPHPGVYELVALPYAFDTLISEAMLRRCPTTQREVSDPCLCLFCGAIFCGQAQCCGRVPGTGGCYRHQKECGGSIGMFLLIRRCAVLFLNEKQGSYMMPPYLDRHGEIDLGLRRKNQLFLNQMRYDRLLRDVWLSHSVPSFIARKLESEVNTGGWETL